MHRQHRNTSLQDLDMELEVLKKRRLMLHEERQLIEEKQQLQRLQAEIGMSDSIQQFQTHTPYSSMSYDMYPAPSVQPMLGSHAFGGGDNYGGYSASSAYSSQNQPSNARFDGGNSSRFAPAKRKFDAVQGNKPKNFGPPPKKTFGSRSKLYSEQRNPRPTPSFQESVGSIRAPLNSTLQKSYIQKSFPKKNPYPDRPKMVSDPAIAMGNKINGALGIIMRVFRRKLHKYNNPPYTEIKFVKQKIRERLYNLMHNKEIVDSYKITQLYREVYPLVEDTAFLEECLEEVESTPEPSKVSVGQKEEPTNKSVGQKEESAMKNAETNSKEVAKPSPVSAPPEQSKASLGRKLRKRVAHNLQFAVGDLITQLESDAQLNLRDEMDEITNILDQEKFNREGISNGDESVSKAVVESADETVAKPDEKDDSKSPVTLYDLPKEEIINRIKKNLPAVLKLEKMVRSEPTFQRGTIHHFLKRFNPIYLRWLPSYKKPREVFVEVDWPQNGALLLKENGRRITSSYGEYKIFITRCNMKDMPFMNTPPSDIYDDVMQKKLTIGKSVSTETAEQKSNANIETEEMKETGTDAEINQDDGKKDEEKVDINEHENKVANENDTKEITDKTDTPVDGEVTAENDEQTPGKDKISDNDNQNTNKGENMGDFFVVDTIGFDTQDKVPDSLPEDSNVLPEESDTAIISDKTD